MPGPKFRFQVSRRRFLQAALIVVATLFVYWPAWHGGWLWDDDVEITGNRVLRDPAGLGKVWFAPQGADYFPLKTSLQWVQWHFWGASVTGYHVTNVGLHLLSAFLLWHLLGQLGVRLAWLGGLIFAIHPLAVESVAWISELKNVLSLPWLLLAFSAWLEFDRRRSTGCQPVSSSLMGWQPMLRQSRIQVSSCILRRRGYVLSLILFVLAMLSKSSVVMFPFVLLLYAWWKRGRVGLRDLLASAPFFAVALVLGIVTVWFQSHRAIAGEVILTGGFPPRLAAAGLAVAFYFSKAVFPAGLMPIYPRWVVEPPSLWMFWPWVIIGGAFFWLISNFRSRRSAFCKNALFGLGCFFLFLLPVLGFVPMSFLRLSWVADHFAYLPLVGLAGLAAAGVSTAFQVLNFRFQIFGSIVIAALLAALAVDARRYAARFADSQTLWTYNLQLNPQAWAARNNLGNALYDAGRLPEAQHNYEEALRLHPDYPEVDNNLGNLLSQTGRAAEAARYYWKALQLMPDYAQAHDGLGNLLFQAGHAPEAIDEFDWALHYRPDDPDAHNNLANVLFQLGRYGEAEAHVQKALSVRPDYPEAHNNLGNILLRTGRLAAAMAEYREALRLKPDFPEAWNNVGNIQMMSGRLPEAAVSLDAALRIRPGYAEAHYNLGLVLAATGRTRDAIVHLKLALQSRPDFPQALAKLEQLEKN